MSPTAPRDAIDEWLLDIVPGRSFVDIGGIGVGAGNERTVIAKRAGASSVAMADIRPSDYFEWDHYRKILADAGISGVEEFAGVDIRRPETLRAIGRRDVVHSTGILYHVPSPAEALWNLRAITGRYLITNTVTFPGVVKNKAGTLTLPDAGVLFMPALSETDRQVLNLHYETKFGWTLEQTAPRITDDRPGMNWVEHGELTCWPYWYLYTDHAFRSLLALCKLKVVKEWKWADHTLQVLCEVVD